MTLRLTTKILILTLSATILLSILNYSSITLLISIFNKNAEDNAQLNQNVDELFDSTQEIFDLFGSISHGFDTSLAIHLNNLMTNDNSNLDKGINPLIAEQHNVEIFINKLPTIVKYINTLVEANANSSQEIKDLTVKNKDQIDILSSNTGQIRGLLDSTIKSRQSTIAIMRGDDFEAARSNYAYEESYRVNALNDILGKSSDILNFIMANSKKFTQLKLDELSSESAERIQAVKIRSLVLLIVVAFAVAAFSILFLRFKIRKPLMDITNRMMQLSQGNLTIDLPPVTQDEIGEMVAAMKVFKETAVKSQEMQQDQLVEQRKKEERQNRVATRIKDFESQTSSIVSIVNEAADALTSTANTMIRIVNDTNQRSNVVAEASNSVSGSVMVVANATGEMTTAIKDISQQVQKVTDVVNSAVKTATQADQTAQSLSNASAKISEIVELIQNIARQINLLSLNATIESARAGEAGRGFAVVAAEVKNLAQQTAEATDEIANQIKSVQSVTQEVVQVIEVIKNSISTVNEYSGLIAAAIVEQDAVTQSISQNMNTTAASVKEVSVNINNVTSSTLEASKAAEEVLKSSEMLSKQSGILSQEVNNFVKDVKA